MLDLSPDRARRWLRWALLVYASAAAVYCVAAWRLTGQDLFAVPIPAALALGVALLRDR